MILLESRCLPLVINASISDIYWPSWGFDPSPPILVLSVKNRAGSIVNRVSFHPRSLTEPESSISP